jgi:hypothetical protein
MCAPEAPAFRRGECHVQTTRAAMAAREEDPDITLHGIISKRRQEQRG